MPTKDSTTTDTVTHTPKSGLEYQITEGSFSYSYTADGYQDAIAQWISATFELGCTASEPDNFGHFAIHTPLGRTIKARIQRRQRHTPAQFRVGEMCGGAINIEADTTLRHITVARVHVFDTTGEAEANARLFAAAPELLDALRNMTLLIDKLWDSVPWGKTFNLDAQLLNEAPIAARKAIAKAEGRA